MTAAPLPAGRVGIKTWVGFVAMAVGMFLAILDIQIVASSLPEIQTGLGISLNQLSWVQTAYLMAEIVAIPLTGWLTRVMSTRGAFFACICGFTAASLACAASTSFWSLISGAGGAGLLRRGPDPARLLGSLPDVPMACARARERWSPGCWRCWHRPSDRASAALSPTAYSWHWLFLINVPPGIIVALLVAWAVDVDRPDRRAFAFGRSRRAAIARGLSRRLCSFF